MPTDWPEARKRLEGWAASAPYGHEPWMRKHVADLRVLLSRADRIDALEAESARLRETLESAVSEIELAALSMPVGNKRRMEMQERNQTRRAALSPAPSAQEAKP